MKRIGEGIEHMTVNKPYNNTTRVDVVKNGFQSYNVRTKGLGSIHQ